MIHDMMQNYLNCENGEFKIDFQLLFYEHRYLTWYETYTYQIFKMYREHSYLGKGVSDYLFRS